MVRDQLIARGISDRAALAAMRSVPREPFMPPDRQDDAYADYATSIGRGQTISQPYIVARMTELLRLSTLGWPWSGAAPRFLDVGTGSGYQAALLAHCGGQVTSVERDEQLALAARDRLHRLGYDVDVVIGDGSMGAPEHAPYAGIVVGAGAPEVPEPLVEQLADGGHLVLPVGPRRSQRLTVIARAGQRLVSETADACVFVPLVGARGHPD